MHGESSRAHGQGWVGAWRSATRLRFTRFTQLLGPTRGFGRHALSPITPGDTPQSVRLVGSEVATDSRRKTRFSVAVIDLTVAIVWTPAHLEYRPRRDRRNPVNGRSGSDASIRENLLGKSCETMS